MQIQNILASVALISAASASPAFNLESRQTPTGACSTGVHVIAVGGANYSDPYNLGRLTPLAQSIVARIPDSTWSSVPYNKVNVTSNPNAVPGGIANLVNYVNEYHAACPAGKIVLAGYSAGAVITMDGICGGALDASLAGSTIIATVAYGDQTRVPGQSYDLGTCPSGFGKLGAKRNPAGCDAFNKDGNSIQSYCDTNDPECCDGPPQDYQVHFVYPGKYDGVVTDWVASKFAAAGGSASTSVSSSATTSAATGALGAASTTAGSPTTVSPTAPMSYAATSTGAAATSLAIIPNNATATSTLTPANPNGAFAVAPASGLIGVALAAILFMGSIAL